VAVPLDEVMKKFTPAQRAQVEARAKDLFVCSPLPMYHDLYGAYERGLPSPVAK